MNKKKISISEIRKDLYDQLESQMKYGQHYYDMVEDYISFYKLKKKLKKDIEDNGIRYKVTNGNGIETEKPNESIINLTKVNSQMLKILSDLDLKSPQVPQTGETDDDLC